MTGSSSAAAEVRTVILLRHGRSVANQDGILAGRTPAVELDATGLRQAAGLIGRLGDCRIERIVSSPLLRCRSTVEPFAGARQLAVTVDDRFAEVDYGTWTGRRLVDLATEPLWRTVQDHPSAAVFPGGEGLAAVSARAAAAVRDYTAGLNGSGALLICSHGDVIKAILADALGLHLDLFQRLVVSPASVSVVRYTAARAFVERMNDTGSLDGIGSLPAAGGAPGGDDPGGNAPGDSSPSAADAVVGGDGGRPAA